MDGLRNVVWAVMAFGVAMMVAAVVRAGLRAAAIAEDEEQAEEENLLPEIF